MPNHWRIRSYLLTLVLTLALPLGSLLLLASWGRLQSDLRQAHEATRALAAIVAADSQRFVFNARDVLGGLARRPRVRAGAADDCDPILRDFKEFVPQLANIAMTDRHGTLICSVLQRPGAPAASVAQQPWFDEVRRNNRFTVGAPHIGPVSGKWVAVLAQPIQDDSGAFNGLLGYAVDLVRFAPIEQRRDQLGAIQLTVVDRRGAIVATSGAFKLGDTLADPALLQHMFDQSSGYRTLPLQGEDTVLGFAHVPGADWLVMAQLPQSVAHAGALRTARIHAAVALIFMALGIWAARQVARRIIQPTQQMAQTAQAVTEGDFEHRATEAGPVELARVARAFNTMLDVRLRSEARYRGLLESASDAIVTVDAQRRITLVNHQATELFGYSTEELMGQRIELLVPEALRTRHENLADHYLQEGGHTRTGSERRLRARRKDGTEFPVEIGLSPLQTPDGLLITAIVRDVTERQRYEERLTYLANFDLITGLPNRHHFRQQLEQAALMAGERGTRLALFFLDIDRFKDINDTLGHLTGDRVLREVGHRLRDHLSECALIARLGGDEFFLLLENVSGEAQASDFAQRIQTLFQAPLVLGSREVYVTLSIGVTLFPDDSQDIETLVKNADVAMYRSKGEGRNTCRRYTPEMDALAHERLHMEGLLRRATERGELSLHYQPQVDHNGHLVGAEALLRWHSAELGSVSPGQFIPIAENSGLILNLGAWVLHEACRQARQWLDAGHGLRVAVNLSAHQFRNHGIAQQVREVLALTGLPPALLELEITESTLMHNPQAAAENLHELRQMGVSIALDDFGTGYSSLAYLRQMPVTLLKIDQSFVRESQTSEDAATVVSAIIGLARAYHLKVIAEGVETTEQRDFLRSVDCDYFQGYFYSRPLPPETFEAFARQHAV